MDTGKKIVRICLTFTFVWLVKLQDPFHWGGENEILVLAKKFDIEVCAVIRADGRCFFSSSSCN